MNLRSSTVVLPVFCLMISILQACNSSNNAAEPEIPTEQSGVTDSTHSGIQPVDSTLVSHSVPKDTTAEIKTVLDLYNRFEKTADKLSKKEIDVEEESSEGGSIELAENKKLGIGRIRKELFGEMQQIEESFYYRLASQELVIVTIKELAYQKPLTTEGATEQKLYQIFSGGNMIAMLDEERDRQEMSAAKMLVAEKDSKEYFNALRKKLSEKK